MTIPSAHVVAELAPTGVLRAAINLGNPVLAQGTAEAPAGVTVDIAREVAARLLCLSRTLQHAQVVRGAEGVDTFTELGLEAGAGIRQPMTAFVARHAGLRLLEPPFMQIRQALGTTRSRTDEAVRFLAATIEELKASGFGRRRLGNACRAVR